MTPWRVVCDAGGTNVRVARVRARRIERVEVLPASAALDIAALLAEFAATFEDRDDLEGAAIAAAGPVQDGAVKLTNADVTIRADAVRAALQRPVRLMNDLEAVAWALPHLTSLDLRPVRACDMPLAGGKLAINIGTGFGAALLLQTPGGAHVCPLEPGHMKLAISGACPPGQPTAQLSIEDVLSGKALANPQQVAALWGWAPPPNMRAGDLFSTARETPDGQSFLNAFSAVFGQVCGDLVLATGAWGGVTTTGSVAAAWLNSADLQAFSKAFCDKGPMSARISRVPVQHIVTDHPALVGLAAVPLDGG